MRDLEVCLTGRDIWHMLSEAGEKESGIKNSAGRIILLILTVISGIYYWELRPVFQQLSGDVYFTCVIMTVGGLSGTCLIITCIKKASQWYKLIRGSSRERYHLRFGESQIEKWFDNGKRERYPYSSLSRIQKTKRMLLLYENGRENTKTLLVIPASSFANKREMELCAEFLKNMQLGIYDKEDHLEQEDQESEVLFTLFVQQEEAEWIDETVRGMHFSARTKYGMKISRFLKIIPILAIWAILNYKIFSDMSPLFWIFPVAAGLIGSFWFIIWKNYSWAGIRSQVKETAAAKMCLPDHARYRTISLDPYGIRVSSTQERWRMPYEMAFVVFAGAEDIFVFFKDSTFLGIL